VTEAKDIASSDPNFALPIQLADGQDILQNAAWIALHSLSSSLQNRKKAPLFDISRNHFPKGKL
jgi:hypothetical protein